MKTSAVLIRINMLYSCKSQSKAYI